MTQPYIRADREQPVRVMVNGVQRSGQVLGWRGERVYVRYRGPEDGNHLAWVDASAVARCST